jgi:hypothetical protein
MAGTCITCCIRIGTLAWYTVLACVEQRGRLLLLLLVSWCGTRDVGCKRQFSCS